MTGIGQVVELVGISETQVRYWGKQGVLAPEPRLLSSKSGHPGQRRYDLKDLMALAVARELLDKSFSLEEVATFLKAHPDFIERELTSPRPEPAGRPTVRKQVDRANEFSFWRFFLPRALYLALCLLYEAPLRDDTGICVPVEDDGSAPVGRPKIEDSEELARLGKSLLGWHVRGQSFAVFLDESPHLVYPQRYALRPLDALSGAKSGMCLKTGAYVAVHREMEPLLEQSKPEAWCVSQRLLAFVQGQAQEWMPYAQDSTTPLVYYAPEFSNPTLGDSLLRHLAECVAALGESGTGKRAREQQRRWEFCSILLPKDPLAPLLQRSLVVQAQSAGAPHHVGQTTVLPRPPIAASLRAFQSGQVVYFEHISKREPYIFAHEQEGAVQSAIALPIEGQYGEPIGALYVASRQEGAFSEAGDQLLLRMMARLAGELILTYQARHMLVDRLAQVIAHPQAVDPFFREFATESELLARLEDWLDQLHTRQGEQPVQQLALISIDIDQLTNVSYEFGERAARNLVRAVGQRIQRSLTRLLHNTTEQEVRLYRICADHFTILLRNFAWEAVQTYALQLRDVLKRHDYNIDAARVVDEQAIPVTARHPLSVSTALAVTGYDLAGLRALLESRRAAEARAALTLTLDAGVNLAKEAGRNAIAIQAPGTTEFVIHTESEAGLTGNAAPPRAGD
jgi:DNA-binding transcriptional MerR regulator/GGDEF domain-containing protein